MKLIKLFSFALFTLLVVVPFLYSCESDPTRAEILVLDSLGEPIEEATVILYCIDQPNQRPCVVKDTQLTSAAGRTEHDFENPAVLKILAFKYDVVAKDTGVFPNIGTILVGDTLCADGFITLEEYKTVEETVVLRICGDDE